MSNVIVQFLNNHKDDPLSLLFPFLKYSIDLEFGNEVWLFPFEIM
jgi:hypothetical protein